MEWLTGAASVVSALGGLGGDSAPAAPLPPFSVGGLTIYQREKSPTQSIGDTVLIGVVVVVLGGLALAAITRG